MSLRSLVWIPSWMSCSYFHNHDFCWHSCALVWSLSFLTALRCSFWAFNSSALPCISSKAVVHCCAFSASEIRTKKASIPFLLQQLSQCKDWGAVIFLDEWMLLVGLPKTPPSQKELLRLTRKEQLIHLIHPICPLHPIHAVSKPSILD